MQGGLSDPSKVPYKIITYNSINAPGRQWIRKLTAALSDIENNNKVSKKEANDLKNYKKINEDFSAPSASASAPSDVELEGFDNILNNTSIGKIAKEITEELNIEGMAGDGGDMQQLFNPENMMKLFSSINSKVTNNADFN